MLNVWLDWFGMTPMAAAELRAVLIAWLVSFPVLPLAIYLGSLVLPLPVKRRLLEVAALAAWAYLPVLPCLQWENQINTGCVLHLEPSMVLPLAVCGIAALRTSIAYRCRWRTAGGMGLFAAVGCVLGLLLMESVANAGGAYIYVFIWPW